MGRWARQGPQATEPPPRPAMLPGHPDPQLGVSRDTASRRPQQALSPALMPSWFSVPWMPRKLASRYPHIGGLCRWEPGAPCPTSLLGCPAPAGAWGTGPQSHSLKPHRPLINDEERSCLCRGVRRCPRPSPTDTASSELGTPTPPPPDMTQWGARDRPHLSAKVFPLKLITRGRDKPRRSVITAGRRAPYRRTLRNRGPKIQPSGQTGRGLEDKEKQEMGHHCCLTGTWTEKTHL